MVWVDKPETGAALKNADSAVGDSYRPTSIVPRVETISIYLVWRGAGRQPDKGFHSPQTHVTVVG